MSAGVEIEAPSLTTSLGNISVNTTGRVAQIDPGLNESVHNLSKAFNGIIGFLNKYRIGIIRELPLFDPTGRKTGWIGFNSPYSGAELEYLKVTGLLGLAADTVTASFTLGAVDPSLTICDCTGGAITVTLPPIASSQGHIRLFKKVDASANNMVVDGNGAETIDGAANLTTNVQWTTYRLFGGPTQWLVI